MMSPIIKPSKRFLGILSSESSASKTNRDRLLNIRSEDNENLIHFMGNSSGILINNPCLKSSKSYSFIIHFRVENCKEFNKGVIREKRLDKLLTKGPETKLFTGSLCGDTAFDDKKINPNFLDEKSKEVQNPKLFTLTAKNSAVLELSLGFSEGNKRILKIEGRVPKKDAPILDSFNKEIQENTWYALILTYSSKNQFTAYLNGEKITGNKTNFSSICENLDSFQLMTIGGSLNQTNRPTLSPDNFNDRSSFQGQIKNFYILPFELTQEDATQYANFLYNKNEPQKKKTESEKEDILSSSIFNLKAFVKSSKQNVSEEIKWVPSQNKDSKKEKKNSMAAEFMKIFTKKNTNIENERIEVKSKGVYLFEKSRFEDLLFSVGDIDIFLMAIHILSKNQRLKKTQSFDLLCDILNVLKHISRTSHLIDVVRFLGNNGFNMLSELIEEVIIKRTYFIMR